MNQLKSELGIKHLKEEELSQEQFEFLIQRFYSNEEIVKNGNFIIPPFYTDVRCENDGDGDGYDDAPDSPPSIHGFKDGVLNYIKWDNGETYTGEIVDGYPNGKGTKTLPNGTKLIGVFVGGKFSFDGTYTNKAGQTLTISSSNEGCCFDFNVSWGRDDEWGCLLEANGSTEFLNESSEYLYSSDEIPLIRFILKGKTIEFVGEYDFLGDCAKYGDSQSATYTTFKKQ